MKKIKKNSQNFAVLFLLFFGVVSCDILSTKELITDTAIEEDGGPKPKKKLKFKHDGCAVPLGVCLQIPIGRSNEVLTQEERDDYVGFASFNLINNNLLEIAPERHIALSDGSVPITQDIDILPETVVEFRSKFLKIRKGIYQIDYSKNQPYGVVRVQVSK
jgi:hypothetical protein